MKWVRLSGVVLVSVFTALLIALLLLSQELRQAHIDKSILRFASDASVYYNYYVTTYASANLLDSWTVFLRASPILMMILTHGNLLAIQLFNLALMLFSLRVAFDCFKTFNGRMLFLLFCLVFPYFSFGFMSLNKEVYAMCAAIFYGSYMIRGRLWHLAIALLLALAARYYMVASLMMLVVTTPRFGKMRYLWILAALIAISLLAPLIKTFIPEYSYENLLVGSGRTAVLMAQIVDHFGYAPLYLFKYMLLLLVRPYGYLIGSSEDAIGAIASIGSIVMLAAGLYVLWVRRAANPVISQLVLAAFVAPIPMMWSEIMHWRYYSFVYFFLLYAVVLYLEEAWLARPSRVVDSLAHDLTGFEPMRACPGPGRSYFVIVSPAYGGAEKRFFDIFRAMRRANADVMMIAPSSLVDRLLADHPDQPELTSALISIPMQSWRPLTFIRRFRQVLKSIPRGSSFHYPMNCLWPLHVGRGDAVSMSVTNCINVPGRRAVNRSARWTWASFFFVRRVDVLSPDILSHMAGYRTAPKMSLTPGGTFIEVLPDPGVAKAPTVALLSRLIEKKGIDDWLDVLPQVWDNLRSRVPAAFSFTVAGYGPRQDHFEQRIAALAADGIPVTFAGYANAIEFLPRVSVVLSMQEITNYPSRVVAEGLVSGCGVIVRDTGDSRQFGDQLVGLVYCKAALDPVDLANQIAVLLDLLGKDDGYAGRIRQSAAARFSAAASVDYFAGMLYPTVH